MVESDGKLCGCSCTARQNWDLSTVKWKTVCGFWSQNGETKTLDSSYLSGTLKSSNLFQMLRNHWFIFTHIHARTQTRNWTGLQENITQQFKKEREGSQWFPSAAALSENALWKAEDKFHITQKVTVRATLTLTLTWGLRHHLYIAQVSDGFSHPTFQHVCLSHNVQTHLGLKWG